MASTIDILKGIHPGIALEHELKKRGIAKGPFALSINEFPQTISEVTKGKRGMNTSLAMRIEEALALEEGFLMTLQVFYEIKKEKQKQEKPYKPNLKILRPALFWDTQLDKIDWKRQKRAVIERVWERGSEEEKVEIERFYGAQEVDNVLNHKPGRR